MTSSVPCFIRQSLVKVCLGASLYLGTSGVALQAQTLAEAMISAYTYNPAIQAKQFEVESASEFKSQARADYFPSVEAVASGGVEYNDISSVDETQTLNPLSVTVGVSQLVYDWGRTGHTVDSAKAGVNNAMANLDTTEQTALIEAVRAYMDVTRDIRLVELAENNVTVLTNQLDAAKARFEVGEVTRTDVSQATARLALARSNLTIRRGQLAQSRQSYLRATGVMPTDLADPPPLPDLPDTLEDAIAIAMESDPRLQAAQFAIDASEADIKVVQADLLPRFTLDGNVTSSSEQSQEDVKRNSAAISLNMSAPIFLGGRNYSRIRQARSDANTRRAELQDTARLVREAAAVAWEQLQAAQSTIVVSEEQIRAAEVAFEGVKEETKVGFRTTLDLLDAEQELLEARTNLVSAIRDEQVAAYELLESIGLLNVEHLGLEVAAVSEDAQPENSEEE